MSATSQPDTSAARAAHTDGGSSQAANGGLASASPLETLEVLLLGVVPPLVRGLFSPRKSAMKALTRLDADGRAVSALRGIRRRHEGEGLKLLGGRLVVLWGPAAIREVLDRSAEVYASDSGAKGKGMSHFQPEALTLSRGEEWRDRRAFNEAVLGSQEEVHPLAGRFLQVAAEEVAELPLSGELGWDQWERLFDHITLRVIFGDRAHDEQELTARLERLMGEANRLVGLGKNDDYHELYGTLERLAGDPEPDSLVGMFEQAPHTDHTRVIHQIPHWMFAMRDTLAANTIRALAVIVSDTTLKSRVDEELSGADLGDPWAIKGMQYLGGCLHEAMRLWPTVPLLARETTQETTLAGEELKEGSQVMMIQVFNHRDPDHVEDADQFRPERWSSGEHDYRFNHLSNGSQYCPGAGLVMLLGKAAIGRILERFELRLEHPQLQPAAGLPHMFDFYATRFAATERSR